MPYIPRFTEQKIKEFLSNQAEKAQKNVLIVEGARQTGKSTLVQHLLSDRDDVLSINLEKDRILKKRIDQTEEFREFEELLTIEKGLQISAEQILFIDEAQESERIGDYIRFMKEDWKNTTCILSGSSMTRLYRHNQRIPVGRTTRILITPLNFSEFLTALGQHALVDTISNFSPKDAISSIAHESFLKNLDRYLLVGGLPEVVTEYIAGASYKSLRQNILYEQEEDFVRKEGGADPSLFMSAMTAVSNNLGFQSKYSHLNTSYYHAKKIFKQLHNWKLVYEVEQKGLSSTSNFMPKRYLYDIGIAHDIRNMPFPDLSLISTLALTLRTPLGGLFENMVIMQLMSDTLGLAHLSGWKKNGSKEVDFVFKGKQLIPIECKASLKTSRRNFTNLVDYLSLTKLKLGVVVSSAPFEVYRREDKTLVNLPLYLVNADNLDRLIDCFG